MNSPGQLELVEPCVAMAARDILAEWNALLEAQRPVNALYGSPTWFAHLAATTNDALLLLLARDFGGRLVGVMPCRVRNQWLKFDIAGRVLLRFPIRTVEILGSIPLLPKCPVIHNDALRLIFSNCSDCDAIYLDALPTDTFLWEFLNESRALSGCFVHVVDAVRPWHLLDLAPSYEEYLKTMGSKARANLRRDVRKFGERASGAVAARRVTEAAQVSWFLERAAAVSRRSWQQRSLGIGIGCDGSWCKRFEDLATRRILRAYILEAGETPCAFVIGYQYRGIFHYAEVGFDETYAEFSPGKVLLSLMLEDLHTHDAPQTVNFGVGDAVYKRRFANRERSDLSCLIMRRGLRNSVLAELHSAFTMFVRIAKRVIGRKVKV